MNSIPTISILFWINKSKIKDGLAPVYLRVTVNGKRAEISTKKTIHPNIWDVKKEKAKGNNEEARTLNAYIDLLKGKIQQQYNILISKGENITAEVIKDAISGTSRKNKSLIELFEFHNAKQEEKLRAGHLREGTMKGFRTTLKKCKSFIKAEYNKSHYNLEDLKLHFINEFEHFLKTKESVSHNSSMKYSKILKQVLKYAQVNEYIDRNPFETFRCQFKYVDRERLNEQELQILIQKEFNIKRLEEVKDCYIFSCYTGYAFEDAKHISPDNIEIGIDNSKWIIKNRLKTNTPENVPLLPIPEMIIEKYKNHPYCLAYNQVIPLKSNQKYNGYLKEIADLCEIKKNLTSHTARHTFATTVLLANDVPIETAKELLGHKDIKTTQIYGKIIQKKISTDMIKLKEKLGKKELEISQKTA